MRVDHQSKDAHDNYYVMMFALALLGCVGPITSRHACTAPGLARTRARISSLRENRKALFIVCAYIKVTACDVCTENCTQLKAYQCEHV